MFCNEKKLIGLMKESFKTEGLTVGCTGEEYLLAGGQWTLKSRIDVLTNKVKAALVELTGVLPDEGEWITYRKDMEPQLQVPDVFGELKVPEYGVMAQMTGVLFITSRKVLCRVWKGKQCLAVPEVFTPLVDPEQIEPGKEPSVNGPFVSGRHLWWDNSAGVLCVSCATTEEEDEALLKVLEEVL